MKRTIPLLSVAVVTGLLALGGAANTALGAAPRTLNLSGPTTAVVGQSVIFQVSGKSAPPAEYWDLSWIEVVAISERVLSTCPAGAQEATGIAETTTGGAVLAISMRENKDEAGNFTNQVGATPSAAGGVLICAYTANDVGATLSRAELKLSILGGPGGGGASPTQGAGPGAKPKNVKPPRVTRSGRKLVCNPGSWSNGASGYSYRWLVNGKARKSASGPGLRVTRKLRGRKVQCSVTASNAAGTTTEVSRGLRLGR
jgi:hypothetical protein